MTERPVTELIEQARLLGMYVYMIPDPPKRRREPMKPAQYVMVASKREAPPGGILVWSPEEGRIFGEGEVVP